MNVVHVVLKRCAAAIALSVSLFTIVDGVAAQSSAAGAPAVTVSRQRGTVKAIAGSALTLTTDEGHDMAVTVAPNAKILQLAPGSTDLKAAQAITLGDVTAGDRVLVLGAAGSDSSSFQAGRVILMKSTDIAAQHVRDEADWQRRGSGGIVTGVDSASGTVSMSARGRTIAVKTTSSTVFRRYAGDSVKFEDAKRGTLEQIQPGDQIRVRGTRSADAASVAADEIVSGRFENLAGTLTSVDASAQTVTLKDVTSNKVVTVTLTANSAIHHLPPEAAAALAGKTSHSGAVSSQPGVSATPSRTPDAQGGAPREGTRRSSSDLSQVVAHLPQLSISDLHVGDAVLLVATPASSSTPSITAITLVSGVESLLSAAQGSSPAVTLSPWSLGQTESEGAGAQ